MLNQSSLSVLFFIKKTRLLKNGEAPICMRITVNKKRAEAQLSRSVPVTKWDSKKESCILRNSTGEELNHYLSTVKAKVLRLHRELEQDNLPISADILLLKFRGQYTPPKMLIEVFKDHNRKCRALIGKEYVEKSVQRYERTVTYLEEFMTLKYNVKDIAFRNINQAFISDFEHFVKINKNCAQNTTVKYIKNLKKIILFALANNWMDTNPFVNMKLKQTKTNRDFLVEEEINKLIIKKFEIPRLELIRDIFLFCCFTGLSFSDVESLKKHHIYCDDEGAYWIRKTRVKTDNLCQIPLMDISIKIIEKYIDNKQCRLNDCILPVPSNQRMNSYLKEIGALCGIEKKLSTHVARHTFACLALANDIAIESIAKMLGHNDIRTTKIYARVIDKTLKRQMESLKSKFTFVV